MNKTIKSIFKFLFSTQGRVSRRTFFLHTISALGFMFIMFLILGNLPKSDISIFLRGILFFIIFPLYMLFWGISNTFLMIKRLHDLGCPGTHYWKLHIPFTRDILGYRLLLEKGQIHDNEYGPTTWTKEEIEKAKPGLLKMQVNEITKRKHKKKDNK